MAGRCVVRLGIPTLIVVVLAIAALWRIGAPADRSGATAPPAAPLTTIADVVTNNVVDRDASLEDVEVRQVTSDRTFWVGSAGEQPAFAVLDPDLTLPAGVTLTPGAHVTLVGTVRAVPTVEQATREWRVDAATARAVDKRGTYLQVTRISPAAAAEP